MDYHGRAASNLSPFPANLSAISSSPHADYHSHAASGKSSSCSSFSSSSCSSSSSSSSSSSTSCSGDIFPSFPVPFAHRLHAAYSHPLLRYWASGVKLQIEDLMFPIFVTENDDAKEEIKAMPGQYRWGVNSLVNYLRPLVTKGLKSVLIFGVLSDDSKKDERGSWASNSKSPAARAISALRREFPSLLIAADICLCAYTSHGHCGVFEKLPSFSSSSSAEPQLVINNEVSIERIAAMALTLAQSGAHIVAPSDMMDGRIGAIKTALRFAHLEGAVAVMSYSAKFASCFYGPFREAAASGMKFGDRASYQLPPASRSLALNALTRDVEEGADILMIKPGGPYLDLVRDCANQFNKPVAIYQVSGEFAMLYHAAAAGAFDLERAVIEWTLGAKRAGATIIISYFTPMLLDVLQRK